MFFLYQIIILLILFFSPFIIIFRLLKKKEDKKRFIEKFSIPSKKKVKGKLIWFHAACVGDLWHARPVSR